MRVAVAQIVTGEDPQENLAQVEQWVAAASEAGTELVLFPEATQRAFGYSLTSVAEPLGGPWSRQLRLIAQRHSVVVAAGMFTPGQPRGGSESGDSSSGRPRVRNTVLAVGPSVYASYDKIHLYDAFGFQESTSVEAGSRLVHFPVSGVSFGIATCYDIRFPQLFQAHARAGTHATLVPASWAAGPGKVEQWRTLAVARALDSTQYIFACGQGFPSAAGVSAPDGAPTGVGHSLIVSPTGEILAEAGPGPELLVADIDPTAVEEARRTLPVLANARTDLDNGCLG